METKWENWEKQIKNHLSALTFHGLVITLRPMEEKEPQVMSNLQAFEEFIKVQGELGNVGKNREVSNKRGYGYSYTDLGELLDRVKPALKEHHFAVVWELAEMHGRFVIVCKVLWKDGSCVAQSACPILGVHEQGDGQLNPMQEVGSAITYARRYTLLNCLCVACEDDDAQSLSPAPSMKQQTPLLPTPKMRNDNGY